MITSYLCNIKKKTNIQESFLREPNLIKVQCTSFDDVLTYFIGVYLLIIFLPFSSNIFVYYLISCHYSPKGTKLHTSLLSNSFTCLFYLSQQEFHVAYVLIKMGNSPRPAVWALEKSKDNGKTYHPWQYFSDSTT